MNPRESEIETYFTYKVGTADGMMTFKFTSPSQAGVPDRILITHGQVYFIELKAPGKKPRKLQQETVRRMRKNGARVFCLSSKIQITKFLYEVATKLEGPKETDYDEI